MPYTNILRMCLSGLRRIPRQVAGSTHLMGQCQNLTLSSRLVTVRRYGTHDSRIAIDDSQREGPKKTKKTKKDTDPNKPKRPQSNYIIWFMETQGKIKEDNPGFTIPDIAKKAGELWKGMTPDDKKPYEIRAAKLRKEYQEKMEEYNKTLIEEDTVLLEDSDSEQEGKSKPKKAKSKDNSPRKSVSDSKAGVGYFYESQEFISDSESSQGGHSDEDEDRPIKHGLFCTNPSLIRVSNTQINRYSVASENSQEPRRERRKTGSIRQQNTIDLFQTLLKKGLLETRGPQIVTSLPEKFKRTGNETFVTFGITVCGKFPNIELFAIHASSGSDNFQQVCKTTQGVTEYIANNQIQGMVYNENADQFLQNGKPMELTDPKDALQQFIGFLKKHNKPVLVSYGKIHVIYNISFLMNKWGLLDDFISEVPYCFNAVHVVEKLIPRGVVEDLKLATVYEKLMGLKLEQDFQIKRVDALYCLFTEHLQQKADEIEPIHTNKLYTSIGLVKMVVDGQIHFFTMDRLSNAGIGLDHLNFLAEKGSYEFVRCLLDRGIRRRDAEKLYSVCLRNKKKAI